ncbi:MAG: metallophosphoesterase [Spirochaetaceae bacterium]|nr:MAG: metallophosphoesterase [Spirochaetaceae bacterium]
MNRDRTDSIVILLLADTHLGFDAPQRPRIERRRRGEEFFAHYHQALEAAGKRGADLVVHGGDLFYRSKIPDVLVSRAFEPLLALADSGIPVYLVPGNHERSKISPTLFGRHPRIHIFDRPKTFQLEIRGRLLALSGFPSCRSGIRDRFAALVGQTLFEKYVTDVKLLCLHQCVEGAQVGAHNYTFRNGPEVIGGRSLPPDFDAVLAGHIHRYQILIRDLRGRPLPSPVFYPGAIERTSFAERLEQKGFLLLEFSFPGSAERPVLSPTFIPLPCRPMLDVPLPADKLNNPGAELMLEELLASLDPDGIVRLNIRGVLTARGSELLKAEQLRRIAPPGMNLSINWGSIRVWGG